MLKMIWTVIGLAVAAWLAMAPASAQNTTGLVVTTCGSPTSPFIAGRPAPFTVDTTGTMCSQAGGGGGGSSTPFAPNGSFATLTATAASSASTALPTGATVAFQNTSSVDVSCVLSTGAATATTNKTIVRGGATVFVAVGANVNAACINQTGSASNVIVMAGGSGLGTNFGGSGSGGGGGAVTIADGADVAEGATTDAAATAGGTGSLSAKMRLMTTQLGTINTTLGSPFQAGGSIGNTSFGISGTVPNPTTASAWGIGTSTQNSATVANGQLALGQFNTTPTTITSGNMSPLQMDSAGNLLVNIKAGAAAGGTSSNFGSAFPSAGTAAGFSDGTNMVAGRVTAWGTTPTGLNSLAVNANVLASALPSGAATAANQSTANSSLSTIATLAASPVPCLNATASTTNSYSNGATNPANCDLNGNLYVNAKIAAGQSVAATQSGTWTVQPGNTANTTPWLTTPSAGATSGATPHFVVAANSNNSTNLKASAGTVYSIQTSNINASTAYFIKLYDKATAPTCGTDTPVAGYVIPPSNGGNNATIAVGKKFTLGIGYCVVTGIANNDNTSVPAATILVNVDYN